MKTIWFGMLAIMAVVSCSDTAERPKHRRAGMNRIEVQRVIAQTLPEAVPNLAGKDLIDAELAGMNFKHADLTGAQMLGTGLQGANLSEAILERSDLTGANLTDALVGWARLLVSLDDANLTGADFTHAQVDVTFFGAQRSDSTVLDGLTVVFGTGQSLEGFDFSGQNLPGVTFYGDALGSNMRATDFSNADLTNVSFKRVDLTDANFDGAKLDTVFWGNEVTCPDGEPPIDSNPVAAAGCRLD